MGGSFTLGTEKEPFRQRAVITLHGNRALPKIDRYANDLQARVQRMLCISYEKNFEKRHGGPSTLQMFLQIGLPPAPRDDILRGFTINGFDCSVSIPMREDTSIQQQGNIGFDYGPHGAMLMYLAARNLSSHVQYFIVFLSMHFLSLNTSMLDSQFLPCHRIGHVRYTGRCQ